MVDRARSGAVTMTVGSVVMLVGTFLPWLWSGTRDRSSYGIFDLVERLGFTPGGAVSWSLRLWPFVPLVLVTVIVSGWAVVTRHAPWRVASIVTGFAVVWVGGTAAAIHLAPDGGLFRVGSGPTTCLTGAVLAVFGVAVLRTRGSDASGAS